MQKTNKKASILIWAIFLSLIISVTFISISTKINKNLKNNSEIINNIKINNEVINIINSWSISWNFNNQYLTNWDKLIFEQSPYKINLKNNETINLKSKIDNNININITWSPIYYSWTTNTWIIISNWNIETWSWIFILKNLWWYSKIIINNSNIEKEFTNYKIIKKIGNKEIIKSKWKIKNF